MTAITLEVSDELAAKLASVGQQLPNLLSQALELQAAEALTEERTEKDGQPIFQEMLNLLTSRPVPKQILMFKTSPAAQERLEELLDKNREEGLTEEEETEFDVYEQVNDLMILLKAHSCTVPPCTN
jgi:hypothetical protein